MAISKILPAPVRRSLAELGAGINVARRRRKLTAAMMAERLGVGRQTYRRIERGDPTVAMGSYLMALFVLGLDWGRLAATADPQGDEAGTSLSIVALPRAVRTPRTPQPK